MSEKQQDKKNVAESPRNQARRNRIRFAGPRRRLQIDESLLDENYVYHWFNDDKDEVGQAERAGYVFVTKGEIQDKDVVGDKEVHGGNTDLNNTVSRVVGSTRAGGPLRAYLMKLERSLYESDQHWREVEVNRKVDEALRRGRPQGAPVVENAYDLQVNYKPGGQ